MVLDGEGVGMEKEQGWEGSRIWEVVWEGIVMALDGEGRNGMGALSLKNGKKIRNRNNNPPK